MHIEGVLVHEPLILRWRITVESSSFFFLMSILILGIVMSPILQQSDREFARKEKFYESLQEEKMPASPLSRALFKSLFRFFLSAH